MFIREGGSSGRERERSGISSNTRERQMEREVYLVARGREKEGGGYIW